MAKMEFRDGEREVPEHVAWLLRDLDTYRYSYEEATQRANHRLEEDFLNNAQDAVISRHFDRLRSGEWHS